MKTMLGVDICNCSDDLREREVVGEIVFCANCHGVIALHSNAEEEKVDDLALRG